MADEPARRPPPLRPKASMLLMAAPIVLGVGLFAATAGWFLTVGRTSGDALGDKARLRFTVACPEAQSAVLQRVFQLGLVTEGGEQGLGTLRDGTLELEVRTPGMKDDLEHLPAALARPGVLEVRKDGQPVPVKIANVGVQLSFSGTPVTLVMLQEPVPDKGVEVLLDGEKVELEGAGGVELQIAARAGDSREALRLASDRAMALKNPLPCAVTPAGAEWMGDTPR